MSGLNLLQDGVASAGNSAGPLLSGVPAFTWAFCLLIVLSRVGIWTFDMVICQVFQMVRCSAYPWKSKKL